MRSTRSSGAVIPAVLAALAMPAGCKQEEGNKDAGLDWIWDGNPDAWRCIRESDMRCDGNIHWYCVVDQEFLAAESRDCAAEGLVCVQEPPVGCVECTPGSLGCDGQQTLECGTDPVEWIVTGWCNPARGETCANGRCVNSCEVATSLHSNVGCEYWAVDLDNAMINFGLDASSQQFAVVVANPSTALEATVTIERWDEDAAGPVVVDEEVVPPGTLEVFPLDRSEVDGSTTFGLDDGTGTAVTRNAFHVTSTAPIVAYQFNPLENTNVFSNDASILLFED